MQTQRTKNDIFWLRVQELTIGYSCIISGQFLKYSLREGAVKKGHLHDGVILLLQTESFRFLLSCAN